MIARLCRCLLLVSLLLDGGAMPHAFATVAPSGEGVAATHANDAGEGCPMHAAAKAQAAVQDGTAAQVDAKHDEPAGDCCDTLTCDCGCLQAPVAVSNPAVATPAFVRSAPRDVDDASAGSDRRHPPLRPPSA